MHSFFGGWGGGGVLNGSKEFLVSLCFFFCFSFFASGFIMLKIVTPQECLSGAQCLQTVYSLSL